MPSKTRIIFSLLCLCCCGGVSIVQQAHAAQNTPIQGESSTKPIVPPSSINFDTATSIDPQFLQAQPQVEDFLGYKAKFIPELANLPPFIKKMQHDWKVIQESYSPDVYSSQSTAMSAKNAHKWNFFAKKIQKASSIDQLRGINGFMNGIPSKDDKVLYKQIEYWAKPQEMLSNWAGDCEDYVFAKYFALKYFGWSEQDLSMVVIYSIPHKMEHAILAVKLDGKTYILDNITEPKHKLLQPEHYAKKAIPLFVVNTQGIWAFDEGFKEYLEKYRKPRTEGLKEKRDQKKALLEKKAP